MKDQYRLLSLFPMLIIIFLLGGCSNPIEKNDDKSSNVKIEKEKETPKKVILFFGNSLTAGYGLEISQSFPSLIQQKLDSLGYNYEVINAGVSGETTAGGSNRVAWVIERQKVDVFVLELGANDGLRGVPVSETRSNLIKIIDSVRKTYPDIQIILAGMMIPPSMGPEYTQAFQKIYPEIAKEKETALIPFLLKNVAGIDSLNIEDGIHPNIEGQKIVTENVWAVLKDVVGSSGE